MLNFNLQQLNQLPDLSDHFGVKKIYAEVNFTFYFVISIHRLELILFISQNNVLRALPPSLSTLSSLEELSLFTNHIQELSPAFRVLTQLKGTNTTDHCQCALLILLCRSLSFRE